MPSAPLTPKQQICWAQRIQKESINAKAYQEFSIRASVRNESIPTKFKPGHVDPKQASFDINRIRKGESFDPAETGLPEQAVKDFRRVMNEQRSGPRKRHQFFETCGQEIGWVLDHAGGLEDRSVPSGSNPSKLGIGWQQKDGHGGPTTKLAATKEVFITEGSNGWAQPANAWVSSEVKGGSVRDTIGVGPYPAQYGRRLRFSHGRPRRQEAKKGKGIPQNHSGKRPQSAPAGRRSSKTCPSPAATGRGHRPASATVQTQRPASATKQEEQPMSTTGLMAAKCDAPPARSEGPRPQTAGSVRRHSSPSITVDMISRSVGRRPTSAPMLRAASPSTGAKLHELQCQEEALQKALSRSECFLNGHALSRQNSYYRPLSQCDVSRYASNYTETWGKNLYHKHE
mmetsp:Transcript_91870/g.163535  ORF Transcript_91870/g.163535 Transcript_91870/m.163535 type:complete len:400 (-) Transcript_91870:41-1240(-)|eukprot:CAMPEP_0197620778 /NCGR_PEP_ID=MMETSP1338-20131121/1529_1 /TAXON_ID=43686 ORGANISM="Pelagodinium beii, Strain RCC1491" /NCGR_SAMPLE_ID=MMETSP1338 /ASSEMBLY_ACC=CAM_ASM_000754 /LENGTH=399 /DNA_ID=CAMNT_0043190053 /DNA_START=59 /DNA_END=1258 /DNA_ORIENTATION=+